MKNIEKQTAKNSKNLIVSTYSSIVLIITLSLASCAGPQIQESPQKSALTYGMIKSKIQEGQTSQAEILQTFGSPNIVTKNKDGAEVWSYSKQSSDRSSGGSYATILIAGTNKNSSSNSMNTLDLFITFDKKDIVKTYSVVQSQF